MTEVSHPFPESSLTVLVSSSSGGLPPDCTRSWLSVANCAAQMEYARTSTESKAWLAVPTWGSKVSPSMGLLLAVAGYPEPPHALCGRLRLSSCTMAHSVGSCKSRVDGQKVNRISGDSDNNRLWTGVRRTEGNV